ncbi:MULTISPECIES: ABC transporter permease [Streptomyces]|uniref:ABC transporter permease n=1 Tax=Streptomyces TaxID=1883 RepID=UPI000F6F0280|nr:ABC transporter permease [Streptomyces sp. W1SF4]AZM93694.1 ABC transporter permease [Streptomyces sp. W1SF4]
MSTPPAGAPAAARRDTPGRALPGAVPTGLRRGRAEIRVFFRNRTALVFGTLLPLALMLLFGTLFKGSVPGTSVPVHDVVVAGVLASGVMSAAFNTLAIGTALESGDGTLKRLRGTPLSPVAYFLSKALLVLALSALQLVLVPVVAWAAFGFVLPASPARWALLLWVFLLGALASSFLGIAIGSLVTDRRGIGAVLQFPFVLLQFVSGVYYPFAQLPDALQHVGALFPLKWLAQGMRAALLPDSLAAAEPAHGWETGRTSLVLLAWTAAGLVLCVLAQRRLLRKGLS